MKLIRIEELKQVDIRTVDADTLVDIDEINVDKTLPRTERLQDFISKVKNPFCFICNGMIVKTSFAETNENLEDKIVRLCLEMDGV